MGHKRRNRLYFYYISKYAARDLEGFTIDADLFGIGPTTAGQRVDAQVSCTAWASLRGSNTGRGLRHKTATGTLRLMR